MIDRNILGRRTAPIWYDVDSAAIRRFADAVGARDAIHFDDEAARRAGFTAVVAPPTFAISLRPMDVREGLNIDMRKLLHGEQEFHFHRPIVAGDCVSVMAEIVAVSEKAGKSGTMDLLAIETRGVDASGSPVFEGRSTVLIRR